MKSSDCYLGFDVEVMRQRLNQVLVLSDGLFSVKVLIKHTANINTCTLMNLQFALLRFMLCFTSVQTPIKAVVWSEVLLGQRLDVRGFQSCLGHRCLWVVVGHSLNRDGPKSNVTKT